MKWFSRKTLIRSFAEDVCHLGTLGQRFVGMRPVQVEQIVGTVGRASELRPDFMPILKPHGDQRFAAIRSLMERGEAPPVELYKLGERYYVVDGNHRVAAARKLGQIDIDAIVTELWPAAGYSGAAA